MLIAIMRQCAESRFDISQVKVTLSHFVLISKFCVRSESFEPIERNKNFLAEISILMRLCASGPSTRENEIKFHFEQYLYLSRL
jgi:hypothetical protein